jgi:hypothetical protein
VTDMQRSTIEVQEPEEVSSDEDIEHGPEGASNSSGYIRGRGPPKSFVAAKKRQLFGIIITRGSL